MQPRSCDQVFWSQDIISDHTVLMLASAGSRMALNMQVAPVMERDRSGGRPSPGEGLRRRSWDRRRDHGRRIVRDRRREVVAVMVERRTGRDRRGEKPRRSETDRRAPIAASSSYLEM